MPEKPNVCTFSIIPFHIVSGREFEKPEDLFKPDYRMEEELLGDGKAKNIQDFNNALENILVRKRIGKSEEGSLRHSEMQFGNKDFLDSTKYHSYVKDYIINFQPNATRTPSALWRYNLNLSELVGDLPNELDPIPETTGPTREITIQSYFNDPQKVNCYISNVAKGDEQQDNRLSFSFGSVSVYINEVASTGFLVFGFNWDESVDALEALSKLDFFRFFKPERKQKQYFIKREKKERKRPDQEAPITPALPVELTLFQLAEIFFKPLLRHIRFTTQRMTLLHLSISNSDLAKDLSVLTRQSYRALRVPPKDGLSSRDEDLLKEVVRVNVLDESIRYCGMNEGAVVIEAPAIKDNAIGRLINKYTPAFLLALNQREAMGTMSKIIAEFETRQLLGEVVPDGEPGKLVEKLGRMNKLMTVIQMKQVFYSISFYHEVSAFFTGIQKVFDVDTLLKDNRESIEAIHGLLDQENRKREEALDAEREEKVQKRERLTGVFFSVLSLLSVVSALTDGFAFLEIEGFRWVFYPVVTVVVVVFYFLMFYGRDKD